MQTRRRFLAQSAGLLAVGVASGLVAEGKEAPAAMITISPRSADELQRVLNLHAEKGGRLKLDAVRELTCPVREESVAGETSRHALLVPQGVSLDLNGSTLALDLKSNSYGVRLSNYSAIRNGVIKVVHSEGRGSQAIWHSAVSVGAAYDDAGTVEKPGRFSKVEHWTIADLTIDQLFATAAIQLMSEACHGVIRNIVIRDSAKAAMGIGLDWGSLGPITTEDKGIPRMRKLFEQGKILSTHPHDILIENIRVGRLTRNVDGNDAGVRCSACHNVTIRNVSIDCAATAVAIFGGDLGYEFAPKDQRELAHSGYILDDVRIGEALKYGVVLNGNADNITRAIKSHGYVPLRDPVHPGLAKPVVRNCRLAGAGPQAQGIYAVALSNATIEDLDVSGFAIGVHVEDWVRGMRFSRTRFSRNARDKQIEGATEPAVDVTFDDQ